MNRKTWISIAILGIIFPALLFGCGGKKEKGLKTIQGDPEILYKEGLIRFNKKQYNDALKRFEQLKSSFPDSPPFTVSAELKIADSHFFKKEYVEAAAAYEEFKKIHPTHEEIPYVQYQIGMSYFSQLLTLDRDQTLTKKALSSFEFLVANSPPNFFTEKAKDKIRICIKRLADHEFYVGDYYYRYKKYQAAASRFQGLLEKFPKMPDEDKTLFFLGKSYIELDQPEKARDAFVRIVSEYPKSRHYKEARVTLDRGVKGKKSSSRKADPKKGEALEEGLEGIVLARYDEESRKAVPLKGGERTEQPRPTEAPIGEERIRAIPQLALPPGEEPPRSVPPKAEPQIGMKPEGEDRVKAIPQESAREARPQEDLKIALLPGGEPQKSVPPEAKPRIEVKTEGEGRKAALPGILAPAKEKEKPEKGIPTGTEKEAKFRDTALPIDITSDSVETYSKENLIVFKGNVIARQKDMVIYADSIEAVIIEDGRGIEKVIAGGNVKIQQGLRVANSRKAIFYNFDKKVVLTGDPRIWEGNNMVSGDEIVFDIEQNRVEVKGGPGGRGKAKIHPKEETEKRE